ncbi:MAG TPA: hypothetical protein VGM58_10885 [Verrucomicrobiae bacterium]|jgi:hypothetical protein
MKSLQQLFVEFSIDAATEDEVVTWACRIISSNSELANDKLVIEIAALKPGISDDRSEIAGLFKKLLFTKFPNFKFQASENINFAKAVLKKNCEEFLNGNANAGKLRQLVFQIEIAFDFPRWLGDLYNNLDGVEDFAMTESESFLTKETKEVCASL